MPADDHNPPEAFIFLAVILEDDMPEPHCKETPIFQLNFHFPFTCKSDNHMDIISVNLFIQLHITYIKYQERGPFFAFLLSL